ncbi:hypothetical protein C8035_v010035 [Colletotrichum spinosum]|uniref:Uncharacterized protein n=1 Tax=Colletotrichum spinosum TaxID=1347390 RepID=A0A4R8QDB5_9PEZI|nr:hypothetical protein C8035_v010035 [Colletotrichum spinosum]
MPGHDQARVVTDSTIEGIRRTPWSCAFPDILSMGRFAYSTEYTFAILHRNLGEPTGARPGLDLGCSHRQPVSSRCPFGVRIE